MSTTNTDYSWYWYIRKKGRKYYLGLYNDQGDAPASALTIGVYYDEIPDEVDANDDTIPIPPQFEMPIIKAVAAEYLTMKKDSDKSLIALWRQEYKEAIGDAIKYQIEESSQPLVMKPLDLRDDG